MGLIINILMAGLSGTVAYLLGGVLLGLIPLRAVRERVGGWYLAEAMLLLGRVLLVKRRHGGFVLKGSRFDGRENIRIGGETKAFVDETGAMSRLCAMPFGLVHEAADQIWTPFDADLGGSHREKKRAGDFWWTDSTGEQRYCGIFPWDERDPAIVDMDDVLDLTQGSAKPEDRSFAKDLMEIAKSSFNRPKIMDDMKFIVAFGAGFGAIFVASRVVDSVGGGGIEIGGSIPIVIGLAVIPAGPHARDVLDKLASDHSQSELSALVAACIGLVSGVTIIMSRVTEWVCTARIHPPASGCGRLMQFSNNAVLIVGSIALVGIVAMILGRLREQRALGLDAGDGADAEVSD